ncbi:uncharacterized protein LOC143003241 [Genypterus blacodes]|uniref:uncharacterized protein LOC143003241 n=1 Tax=Genypterus blacodes TaxID=154954 RepID=UPI003F76710F
MKFALFLAGVSVVVLTVLTVQAVRQELDMREVETRLMVETVDFKRKDAAITEVKKKISALKLALDSAKTKVEELYIVKAATKKAADDIVTSVKTCETDKEKHQARKTELGQSLAEIKSGHDATKIKIEEETKSLKQQILERDKAICAFVDQTKPEGLRLCGMSEIKL